MYELINPLEQKDGLFPSLLPKKERFPALKVFGKYGPTSGLSLSEEIDDLLNGYERDLFGNRVKKDIFSTKKTLGGLENDEKKFGISFRM